MPSSIAGTFIVPGTVAFVYLLVVSYLLRQSRDAQFRGWQGVWLAYVSHYIVLGTAQTLGLGWFAYGVARLFLVLMALLLMVSARRFGRPAAKVLTPIEAAIGIVGVAWAFVSSVNPAGVFGVILPESGMALAVLYAAKRYFVMARRRESRGFGLLALSLGIWAALLLMRQAEYLLPTVDTHVVRFQMIVQVLLGVAMIVVIYEHEQRTVQENALALSTLDVDHSKFLAPEELEPAVGHLLERVIRHAKTQRAWIYISEPWRGVVPSVQRGFAPEFVSALNRDRVFEPICELAYRRGGIATARKIDSADIPGLSAAAAKKLSAVLTPHGITSFTAIGLQARERLMGVLVVPHEDSRRFGVFELRILLSMTMQVGTTLDNYALMHDAQRRTREYAMLTQVGQVISSRLDPDAVLQAIHHELGKLFDTGTFYVAFVDGDELRFEFETVEGVVQPKRTRRKVNGIAEHIISTGVPLLVRSELRRFEAERGLAESDREAKSFVGVPIKMGGRTSGVICALNYDREFVYGQRDLEVLQTAAGQLAVAMENALLFSEAQQRAKYLSFLNHIANTAISNQETDTMLGEIVAEIQRNFDYDHVGIGILDYGSKDIEIRAEAGKVRGLHGRRIVVGSGIMGRVVRSGEATLVQNTGEPSLLGLLPDARSVMCIPLKYGEKLLGVLNVESRAESAFSGQDALLLNTLADLLSTALHNALVFQKMEQHSITDALTSIKTRRFFMEALQSEWKRAARSGRPFSIVLIDLDKFKEVNDARGHTEGDLVLARVARLLEQKCRQSNVVARYGGDEFIILMPETGVEQAQTLAERLRLWLATDPMLNERHVTGSFGVGSFPLHGATVDEIIRVADAGMYVGKNAGGNRVSIVEVASDFEMANQHRQQLLSYVESFIGRPHCSTDDAAELVSALHRLSSSMPRELADEILIDGLKQLAHAAERRERGAGNHGEEVATYAEVLGRSAGMGDRELEDLHFAALIHDIGKIVIPAEMLNAAGPLSSEDRRVVEGHAELGGQIAAVLDRPGVDGWVRHHHERIDGSGYPDRLRGDEIPMGARILAVADTYVMMTSELSFSSAMSPAEAIRRLESSYASYDQQLVKALAAHVRGERVTGAGRD